MDQRNPAHRELQLTHAYSLFTDADAVAVKVCRDFVRAVLLALGRNDAVASAVLCTSELVTNVHLHTKGAAMIRVHVDPLRLRVSVYDEDPVVPAPRDQDGEADSWGRGLFLVAGTADSWGVTADRGGRFAKGVWFELAG
ncbi:ATP-binding protein [Streptomyces sp. NPDC004111]|uniref:ATP-binding protein n=1 Tax=Streptomyces sp. NPDC004111 TaxID=3364690 RepID=UPI003677FB57